MDRRNVRGLSKMSCFCVPIMRRGHVIDREKAKIGVFISLAEPTAPMKTEAVKAGYYETEFGKYPKIQIVRIKELFEGKKPAIPLVDPSAFKRAQAEPRGKQE